MLEVVAACVKCKVKVPCSLEVPTSDFEVVIYSTLCMHMSQAHTHTHTDKHIV